MPRSREGVLSAVISTKTSSTASLVRARRYFTVHLERLLRSDIPAESPSALEAAGAQLLAQRTGAQSVDRRRQTSSVAHRGMQAGPAQHFDQRRSVASDDR